MLNHEMYHNTDAAVVQASLARRQNPHASPEMHMLDAASLKLATGPLGRPYKPLAAATIDRLLTDSLWESDKATTPRGLQHSPGMLHIPPSAT